MHFLVNVPSRTRTAAQTRRLRMNGCKGRDMRLLNHQKRRCRHTLTSTPKRSQRVQRQGNTTTLRKMNFHGVMLKSCSTDAVHRCGVFQAVPCAQSQFSQYFPRLHQASSGPQSRGFLMWKGRKTLLTFLRARCSWVKWCEDAAFQDECKTSGLLDLAACGLLDFTACGPFGFGLRGVKANLVFVRQSFLVACPA